MSYWVYLKDSGETVTVPAHQEGGTYALGGTEYAELNITYNYASVYAEHDFSIRHLHERTAGSTISVLARIVDELGTVRDPNYWNSSAGNAGHAANILLAWARQYPQATWRVS